LLVDHHYVPHVTRNVWWGKNSLSCANPPIPLPHIGAFVTVLKLAVLTKHYFVLLTPPAHAAEFSLGSTIVGTYGYMAPEQFTGQASPASDLYSLGATLLFLVSGQPPGAFPQQRMCIAYRYGWVAGVFV
jgi:serine/threonine protein kinase